MFTISLGGQQIAYARAAGTTYITVTDLPNNIPPPAKYWDKSTSNK